ncbi:MAG: outer membrane beta-barrel protein [Myxococcaceae bacterium]
MAHFIRPIETLGTSSWVAGAVYARVTLLPPLFLSARIDAFHEYAPTRDGVRATPLFWDPSWVSSQTVTLEYRPHEKVSFRLEYRHDAAGALLYFGDRVSAGVSGVAFVPNRSNQNTLTLGVTGSL